jgi:hypothetical protein
MRVLVACEFSGIVRDAFAALGHDAWSCDLLPSERPGKHLQRTALNVAYELDSWDLMIAHPPCTHLAVSGARWFKDKREEQMDALNFVRVLMLAPIPRICIENPISIISSRIRKPDQIIQPHMFGEPQFKATCLWLKNLPKLTPTNQLVIPEKGTDERKRWNKVHRMPPGPDRWKERSRTFTGIAEAMAAQWGALVARSHSPEGASEAATASPGEPK